MRHIKTRGLFIDKNKFLLTGPNGEKSKKFNIVQDSKKELLKKTEECKKNGIVKTWINENHGSKRVLEYPIHKKFIKFMQNKKDPKILIIGPAKGFEIKNISRYITL